MISALNAFVCQSVVNKMAATEIRLTRTITQMAPDGSSVITDSNARMCSFNGWTPRDNRVWAANGKPRGELRESQGSFAS